MKDFNFVEFKNFVLVGLLNTIIGYSIIIIFIFLKFDNYTSNFLGYFFGMIVSFFLHKNLTFQIQHFKYYCYSTKFSSAMHKGLLLLFSMNSTTSITALIFL